ncbi:LytTR family DNA-binding domain-containing protein [Anaerosporobacter faecicola]|uniref:LytTR family DNA-binding domain-containing protein n=1 Tax=Anaerosporobacter faecicola TaxID=2718714 RepID=UPI00143AD39B|nr:LytTR family DNA-binding domain-containing protein [Anaerosporobacter faecicola]
MKIIIEDCRADEEESITIRSKGMDEATLQLIYALKTKSQRIVGISNNKTVMVNPKDIYYFETVDNRVYIYCKENVYEIRKKLYEIEEEFKNTEFYRASKSVIINLNKIKSLSPAFNGRLEALLYNGEKVIISRQFVPALKQKLML